MGVPVSIRTDGDMFAVFEADAALVEMTKDGDSPNCPRSWTWGVWYDGCQLEGSCDEASLSSTMTDAIATIGKVIDQLTSVRDYLCAFGAFGEEPNEEVDDA